MKRAMLSALVVCAAVQIAAAAEFAEPVRLKGGKEFIRAEDPGFAAPCLADIDKDGQADLLVGQFKDGKIKVYKRVGTMDFAEGQWLKAGGDVAHVPGVW